MCHIVFPWSDRISSCARLLYMGCSTNMTLSPRSRNKLQHFYIAILGVQIGEAHDEFDAVVLGQRHDTNDWIL